MEEKMSPRKMGKNQRYQIMKSVKKGKVDIHVPTNGNNYLVKAVKAINESVEINTLWEVVNVNATDRLGWSDHGSVHFQIVANIALRLTRILNKNGIRFSIEKDYHLPYQLGELIVFLGSILHDLGMSIERIGHEEYSLFLANTLLREMLTFLPEREKTIVISETLHTIISHRDDGHPLTVEAGIVRIADALDMSEGRARIPYEEGKTNIHGISAAAIDEVKISEGTTKLIHVTIVMNNSAGVFQIDELLRNKITGSGLEKYISVDAYVGRQVEKNLLKKFSI
jgi:uncharacterized protein